MSGCLCIHWLGEALSFLRIMHRRGQTATMGLCRGVYVLIARVEPVLRSEICHILHLKRNCILSSTRGTIPHIVTNYPRAYIQRRTEHFRGCLQTPVLNPPKADFSIRCACNQTKVCRRKCSDRRLPNESVPTEVF